LRVMERGNHTIENWTNLVNMISANRHVRAVAPMVIERVLVETEPPVGQSQVDAPYLRGIEPEKETNISVLPSSIKQGHFDVSDRGLLIGMEFADRLNLQVGDHVKIHAPSEIRKWQESREKEKATIPVSPEYEIRGIFDVGYFEYNANVIIASLEDAQDL